MKKAVSTKFLAGFMAVLMVILLLPMGILSVSAAETSYNEGDYTPFLIESIDGKAVYDAQTASMTHQFYIASRRFIDNYAGVEIQKAIDGSFSFSYYGAEFVPKSVYYYRPSDWKNSCGALTCILNFKVGTGADERTIHVALVSFRGTETWLETKTDLKFEDENGYHLGFYKTARNHFNEMSASVSYELGDGTSMSFSDYVNEMKTGNSDFKMIVTGHSLGAAVANIFTSYFLDEYTGISQDNAVAYTYATPCTCSKATLEAGNVNNVFNFINTYDWVPKVGYGGADIIGLYSKSAKESGYRQGLNLRHKVGSSRYVDRVPFSMENHHIGNPYEQLKDYVNSNIADYTDTFVLYTNFDGSNYQRVIYNNSTLLISGSGTLAGDWRQHTTVDWDSIKDSCKYVVFCDDSEITEIGDYAFSEMTSLTGTLVLPETLETIGKGAFLRCSNLTGELVIPESVAVIKNNAFNYCTGLKTINAKSCKESIVIYAGAFAHSGEVQLPEWYQETVDTSVLMDSFYYENAHGIVSEVPVANRTTGNYVAAGSKIYLNRVKDELVMKYGNLDFRFMLVNDPHNSKVQGNVFTENEYAVIDSNGVVTVKDVTSGTFSVAAYYVNNDGELATSADISNGYITFEVKPESSDFSLGGYGTEARPFLISTSGDLSMLANTPGYYGASYYFMLTNSINYYGADFTMIPEFVGTFDGNGYNITGFRLQNSTAGYCGFVGINYGTIKNLTIGNPVNNAGGETYNGFDWHAVYIVSARNELSIEGNCDNSYLGAIAGANSNLIENCHVNQAYVYGELNDINNNGDAWCMVGGLAGHNYATIRKCSVVSSKVLASMGTVVNSGDDNYALVGGITAASSSGTLEDVMSVYNTINAVAYGDGKKSPRNYAYPYAGAGGIAERIQYGGVVKNCYSNNTSIAAWAGPANGDNYTKPDSWQGVLWHWNSAETTNCPENPNSFVLGDNWIQTNGNPRLTDISGMKIVTEPAKREYYKGEALNIAGLKVRVTYDGGAEVLLNNYSVSGYDPETAGKQTVTVSWHGFSETFEVEVFDNGLESIEVTREPSKTVYNVGDELDTTGIVVTAYYHDGTRREITDFTVGDVSFDEIGSKTVTVSYGGKTARFTAQVVCKYSVYSQSKNAYVHLTVSELSESAYSLTSVEPATCTDYGYTGDTVCNECGEILSEGTILDIDSHNHTGQIVSDNGIDFSWSCCGKDAKDDVGHTYGEWQIVTHATCTSTGLKRAYCTEEGHSDFIEAEIAIDPNNHTAQAVYTGTVDVHSTYPCCGETVSEHSFSYAVTTAPTCLHEGIGTYTCECGYSYIVALAIDSNNHEGHVINAGTADQHTKYDCCDASVSADHSLTKTVIKEASCTEDGEIEYSCECGYTYSVTVPAKSHSFTSKIQSEKYLKSAANCLSSAVYYYACADCGAVGTEYYSFGESDPNNHYGQELVNGGTENRHSTYSCCNAVCKSEHVFERTIVIEDGIEYYHYACVCGYEYSELTENARETAPQITFDNVQVRSGNTFTIDLTLKNMPVIKSILINDLYYNTDVFELVSGEWTVSGAAISDWDQENEIATLAYSANKDSNGKILTLTFRVKDDAQPGDYVIDFATAVRQKVASGGETAIELIVIPGVVTVSNVARGDVNGDDFVDSDDAIYLLRHTLMNDRYPINQDGDMNGDGFVDSDDAIYLLRYTLMPDRYPLASQRSQK